MFHAVVQTGSLSKAARQLGTTQPTVGRRLDALERDLGTLVERTARGCVPTPRGEAVFEQVQAMVRAADGVTQAVRSAEDTLEGLVRVACGEMVARRLGRKVPELLDRAPGLSISFVTGLSMANLEAGEADLAVRSRAPQSENLVARRLSKPRFSVFGAGAYVDANPLALTEQRFTACRWIGFGTDEARSARWLASRGVTPALRYDTSGLILDAVASGAGLAVLPDYSDEIHPNLVRVLGPLDDLVFEGWLVSHVRSRRLPRVKVVSAALVRWLAD